LASSVVPANQAVPAPTMKAPRERGFSLQKRWHMGTSGGLRCPRCAPPSEQAKASDTVVQNIDRVFEDRSNT